jgi:hypothetical protein
MAKVRIKSDQLLDSMKSLVTNRTLMESLGAIITLDDDQAISTIRSRPPGHPDCLEAEAVLFHNERFRSWFRRASDKEDPFAS